MNFHKVFCFDCNFLSRAFFSIPSSQVIYIFLAPSIKTNCDYIHGYIQPFHNGHFGHFDHFGHYGTTQYGHEYGHYWCLWKEHEKCRLPAKTVLKKMNRVKSFDRNKILYENWAKNCQFPLYSGSKLKMGGRSPSCQKNSFFFDFMSIHNLRDLYANWQNLKWKSWIFGTPGHLGQVWTLTWSNLY